MRNNFVMVDKEFLEIAIENMRQVEYLKEMNDALRTHAEQLERKIKSFTMMYENYR